MRRRYLRRVHPQDAFVRCYLALLVELWSELESLLERIDAGDEGAATEPMDGRAAAPAATRVAVGLEVLRLELALLEASCAQLLASGRLTRLQQLRIKVIVGDLQFLFAGDDEELGDALPQVVERAQNRLYDEVHSIVVSLAPARRAVH